MLGDTYNEYLGVDERISEKRFPRDLFATFARICSQTKGTKMK